MSKTDNFKPRTYKIKNGWWTTFDGLCKGCGLCIASCPLAALSFSKNDLGVYNTPAVKINPDNCRACRTCEQICPDSAIKISLKE